MFHLYFTSHPFWLSIPVFMQFVLSQMAPSLPLNAIVVCGLFSLLGAIHLIRLYSRYNKLRHIPGPFLASFTNVWRVYHQRSGNFVAFSRRLHAKYGPVVRIGPNAIHLSDATAVSTIYTSHGEFKKVLTLRGCFCLSC